MVSVAGKVRFVRGRRAFSKLCELFNLVTSVLLEWIFKGTFDTKLSKCSAASVTNRPDKKGVLPLQQPVFNWMFCCSLEKLLFFFLPCVSKCRVCFHAAKMFAHTQGVQYSSCPVLWEWHAWWGGVSPKKAALLSSSSTLLLLKKCAPTVLGLFLIIQFQPWCHQPTCRNCVVILASKLYSEKHPLSQNKDININA